MAQNPNISRLTDRDTGMEQYGIERLLLNNNPSAFENRLYRRGTDLSLYRYFKYPLELMEDEAHMGAMVFEIYDNNPERLATTRNRMNVVDVDEAQKAMQARQAAEGGEKSVDIGDIAGAALGAVQGGINQALQGVLGALAGGVINPDRSNRLAENSFVEEATGIAGGTTRVDARIYLYIPNNIESGYGFEYETTNMSALDVMKLPKALSQGDAQAAQAIGRKLAMSNMKMMEDVINKIPGVEIEAGVFAKSIEASQRQIVNPMQLHLFKEVKRRSFSFAYTFLPKSREEMLNCHAIINMFKYYAHPGTSGAGRFLDYPAEFTIRFHQNNIINGYLPYIFKCALTGIKVTYGEETVMSTFEPDAYGAAPTKIKLELTFDELEILTRDRFALAPGSPNP